MNPRSKRRIVLSTAVVGGLAAVVAGGLMARSWYRADQLADKRRDGLALFSSGRFAEALEPLSFAARNNDDLEAVLALAECRMRLPEANGRHFATAAGYFRAVEARDAGNVRAMRGLLEAYIGLGRLPEIPPVVRRLLAVSPKDVRAHEIELEVLSLTGKFGEAAAKARALQELDPANPRWRAAELVSLERSGADAEGRLARVQEWRRDARLVGDASLTLLESDLLRELGRTADARAMLRGLAEAGVADRRALEALIAAIESNGFEVAERDRLVERAIAQSRGALANAGDASQIEGERLLRAGRLDEISKRFAESPVTDPGVFRLRFAALYLSGRTSDAAAFAAQHAAPEGTRDLFTQAALLATSTGSARARIEGIAGPNRACPKDPIVAILLSDVMLEAGEFDEAQAILVRSFESSGDGFQPVGVRAVRASVALGRVRDAFRIAEDLLVRYGATGDGSVALLAVEAWASVLEANYRPTTRGGVYGTDSPEALRRFWAALGGADAQFGPASLAPAVADVFLSRGDRQTAKEILEHAVAQGGDGAEGGFSRLGGAKVSRALKTASSIDPALQGAILDGLDGSAELAAVVAERLIAQNEVEAAIRAIDRALPGATGADKRRLERVRRPLVEPNGVPEWLAAELKSDPSLDTAVFVLSRREPWNATDDALVASAIGVMKDSLGAESLRVLVAEAAMTLTFHGDDRARLANSIAALDAAAMRSPDAASVLTTLAALFERQSPPQFDRSAKLLARAAAAEPGSAAIYPQLVNALQQIGDFDGAESALEAYIQIVGDDLQSKRSVAEFKARQGQLAEAAQIREQLVGRSKEVVDAVALARIRQRLGDAKAAEALLVALRTSLLESTRNGDESDRMRELIVERELALIFARDGRMDAARASLDSAEARLHGPRLDEVRANVELAYGSVETALRMAETLVKQEASANHELLLARVAIRSGDLARAREALTRSLVADPDNAEATTVAAALLVGDPTARSVLDRTLSATSARRPDLAASIALLDQVTDSAGRIRPDEASLARSVALTAEFSGSPLVWRVCAHLHLLADRRDDAFRIAQRALTRLPSDAAIGKLATETAIAAGRVDDAASAALAWRKMASAEAIEVDVARASIALMQRRPELGFPLVKPLAREILTRTSDAGALRTLVGCAVLGGKTAEIRDELAAMPASRRAELVEAWIECTQALPVDQALAAIGEIATMYGDSPAAIGSCVAAWTTLCRAGSSDACTLATNALASLKPSDAPTPLLAADLAAARGDSASAIDGYRAQYEPVLSARGLDPRAGLAAIAARCRSDEALLDAFRANPVAIVAMNNAAECMIEQGARGDEAAALAAITSAALGDSPDALDTLARALVLTRRYQDAIETAARNPDPVLSAIATAEIELARGNAGEARRALSRADARVQASFAPTRSLSERIKRLQESIRTQQSEADASVERSER